MSVKSFIIKLPKQNPARSVFERTFELIGMTFRVVLKDRMYYTDQSLNMVPDFKTVSLRLLMFCFVLIAAAENAEISVATNWFCHEHCSKATSLKHL